MRDRMRIGDGVLFYHSSCPQPGIAGLAEVCSTSYPDPTQFDAKSHYHDPASKPEAPRWMLVDVKFVRKCALIDLPSPTNLQSRSITKPPCVKPPPWSTTR